MELISPPRSRSPVVRRRAGPARVAHGRRGLFASAYARMGSGIFLALGIVELHARGLAPAAILLAGLVVLAVAASYAEGISLFPEAGGPAALARHAFDELASFATGWAMTLALIAAAALAALSAAKFLSVFWAPLGSGAWAVAGGLAVLAVVAGACALGLELSASVAAFAGIADIGLQLLLVVVGVAFAFRPDTIQQDVHLGTAPSVEQLVLACALATVVFVGVESIGDMAAEARDPDRDLGPTSAGVLLSAITLGVAISLTAAMAGPVSGGGQPARPLFGIVTRVPLHVLATGLKGVVGLIVAALLALVAHAALGRTARLVCWQAQHRQFPAAVAGLDQGRAVPVTALAACSAGAALLVVAQGLAGDVSFLAGTYAFAALIAFSSVHLSVLALRWRDPGRSRPVAAPLNVAVDGRRLPLAAVLGLAGTTSAWLAVAVFERDALLAGWAWMLAGLAAYAAYRRSVGLSLGERTRREPAPRTGPGVQVEYQTILIPVNTAAAGIPSDLLDVAAQLAAERRTSLVLLAFTEIPLGEEMDLEIDDLDASVGRLAAAGRAVEDRYGIHVLTTHLRTRDPAESILAEANRRESQVILLRAAGLQRAGVRRVAYDHAVRRIVAEARQRVMIVRPEQPAT
jgi:APA family basic amino acid/polyamine antiporter